MRLAGVRGDRRGSGHGLGDEQARRLCLGSARAAGALRASERAQLMDTSGGDGSDTERKNPNTLPPRHSAFPTTDIPSSSLPGIDARVRSRVRERVLGPAAKWCAIIPIYMFPGFCRLVDSEAYDA